MSSPAKDRDNQPIHEPTEQIDVLAEDAKQAICLHLLIQLGLVSAQSLSEEFKRAQTDSNRINAVDWLVQHKKLAPGVLSAIEHLAGALTQQDQWSEKQLNDTLSLLADDHTLTHVGQDIAELRESRSLEPDSGISETFQDYTIIHEIARGGMGIVYKARQISLNRVVALKKVLLGSYATEQELRRFQIEAEASANLDHPGIVPVYDFGQHQGQPYFSMGYVEGQSLAKRLSAGPLAVAEAIDLLIQIAEAVAYANGQGVIHRDLKPANILLDANGVPRITDFGLAKTQASESEMTATGQILGTPSYMPPEQASGQSTDVDQRADVYALGAILYCALTGRPPFQASNPIETMKQVLEQEPAPVRQLNADVPRDLETICLKCLRKEPERRYKTADQLVDDLERFRTDRPILARRVSLRERSWKWCRRRPVVASLILAIILITVVGSFISVDRVNRSYSTGLLQQLATAEPNRLTDIVTEIGEYQRYLEDDVRSEYSTSDDGSFQKLHLGLALLQFDQQPQDYLVDRALTLPEQHFEYFESMSQAFKDHSPNASDAFWNSLRDVQLPEQVRFRAAILLAQLDPQNDRWTQGDYELLIRNLFEVNPVYQPDLWPMLDPVHESLLPNLKEMFSDEALASNATIGSANAVAFYCADRADIVAPLLPLSNASQFQILFPIFVENVPPSSIDEFRAIVQEQPDHSMLPSERVLLGRRRAKAAIVLLHLGDMDSMLDVLRYDEDPEAMTQFIHLSRDFGIDVASIVECFVWVDSKRGPLGGTRQKIDDSILYATLLTLGEYPLSDLGPDQLTLPERLLEIYRLDPSSGVHSAAGWLLRTWGFDEEVEQVDQTVLAQDPTGHREWYVMEIDASSEGVLGGVAGIFGQTEKLHLTMIDFQPGMYVIGTDESDPNFVVDQTQKDIAISLAISVCDRELMWQQVIAKEGTWRVETWNDQFGKDLQPSEPVFGFNWFESAEFCVWLTTQAGMKPDEQCYVIPEDVMNGTWTVAANRPGFRLPLEIEWEYVCRSGTETSFSFGSDLRWIDKYAWNMDNSNDWSHQGALLRPNPRGLFDIHGNMVEHCWDWFGNSYTDDPYGPDEGQRKVTRGGSWKRERIGSRSAVRDAEQPDRRDDHTGFRLFRGPTSLR